MWFSIIGCLLLLVVYACTTHIGRVLKRRWGVKLGGEFHMLCVAISFRVGFIFFPHDTNEQGMLKLITISQDILNFLSAAMVILGTLFIVKMVNRFYWEGYFQKKRQMVVPRFLTHSTMLLGLLASVLAVMQFIYGVKLQGLFVGGAIGTAGIALALQSILKNLFAGFTLQFDKPYRPGDWLLVEGDMGQVMEINWRSTRMRTIDHIYLDLPNADMISNKIINLNYPVRLHAFRVQIPADYSSPPNQVREILMDSVGHVDGIRKDPPPEVFVKDFDDRAAIYEIKYWLDEDEKMDRVADAIRTGAWYALHRAGMSIPWPKQVVQFERKKRREDQTPKMMESLSRHPMFSVLNERQLHQLVEGAKSQLFGRGQKLVRQGQEGDFMLMIGDGEADVMVEMDGKPTRVGLLREEDCVGEMAMLTGEAYSANVVANRDTEVVQIPREKMGIVLRESPELLERLSEILALRKLETEVILAETASQRAQETDKDLHNEYANDFLGQ
ncbi:MAG: cyclic nucleotide-binding domain-containing protein, partial [Verrucomicrobiia bacterium]